MLGDLWGNYSQEDLYQIAISRPLAEKVASAITLFQTYENQALQLSPDGYYACNSYGKDSGVVMRLLELSGVKYKGHYNNVTIDPPDLVQHGKRHYPDTIWHSVGTPLPLMMAKKSNGPPTRLSRWCCEIYKEQGGRGHLQVTGVRAEESLRRKGLWKMVNQDRNKGGGLILCPIVYWTEADVWQFTKEQNIPYCCLYDQGYKRLGCIGCPMGGPVCQARDFARWPKYEALWKRGFQVYWDTFKGTPRVRPTRCPACEGSGLLSIEGTDADVICGNCEGSGKVFGDRWIEKFSDVDALWKWWISGKAYEGEGADCQQFLW